MFLLEIEFSYPENDFCPWKIVFLALLASVRGRGGSGRVWGRIILFRNRLFIPGNCFCHAQGSIVMLGDAWGTPGGRMWSSVALT